MATTEANKRYIAKHPDRVKARFKKWYYANQEALNARRRAKLVPVPRKRVSAEDKKEAAKARTRSAKYGVSADVYALMLEVQGGLCKICRKPEVTKSRYADVRSLGVDHNHNTGAVRGLLCQKCNMAVGLVNEDVLVLRAMIEYLDSYNG